MTSSREDLEKLKKMVQERCGTPQELIDARERFFDKPVIAITVRTKPSPKKEEQQLFHVSERYLLTADDDYIRISPNNPDRTIAYNPSLGFVTRDPFAIHLMATNAGTGQILPQEFVANVPANLRGDLSADEAAPPL